MSDSWDELKAHQRKVELFGGRIDSPARKPLQELGDTVLGSTKPLPTSGSVPISAAPITLAEMVVSHPIAVDVSFAYPNLMEGVGLGAPLSPGDGYVQVTWGVKGATKQVAKIDGNFGWRHQFVASQILVQYFPVDVNSTGGRVIPVNQPRDLQIAGMISPASGAQGSYLTKTLYYPDIAIATAAQQQTPLWATEWAISLGTNVLSGLSVSFFDAAFALVAAYNADGVAGGYPLWQIWRWYPVPQGGVISNLGSNVGAPVGLNQPKIIFRLAL